jgi:hypothetical protein
MKKEKGPKGPFCCLERVMGIEPTLFAWEAKVLPLNYTRVCLIVKPLRPLAPVFQADARYVQGRR